ncbi:hypothetical protein OSB04_026647 [Centaurea solstitialis]|uniref:Uncharacterized protein n=1 Tax=Centaurea solstitialis TaxID=347529 RepID=A0AA38W9H2_9ASTR|nr:hypothetical protein OSB04_026647 [Centaurea solstitialis]
MASATAMAVALAAAVIAWPPVTTMVVVFAIVVSGDGDIGAQTDDDNGGYFPGFFSPIGALSRGLEHIGAPPWGIEVVVGTPPGAAVADHKVARQRQMKPMALIFVTMLLCCCLVVQGRAQKETVANHPDSFVENHHNIPRQNFNSQGGSNGGDVGDDDTDNGSG